MKKIVTKILCVLMALSVVGLAACGKAKPTAEYLEFYGMAGSASYELRNTPEGYVGSRLNIDRWEDSIDFRFGLGDASFSVTLMGNPKEPIYVWYRVVEDGAERTEKIAMLSYATSTATPTVSHVKVNSKEVKPSHEAYDGIVATAQQVYEDWLPVLNDVIAQISGQKYASLDVLRVQEQA